MKKFNSCLIVDDEIELLDAMRAGVDFLFDRIDTCTEGRQALELCSIKRYDLIICNIQMSNMNGEELLKRLRNKHVLTPFMFVGDSGNQFKEVEFKNHGVAVYLEKPFDFEVFIEKVQEIIEKRVQFDVLTN